MIEVWRARQRKPRRTEAATVVHHFVARPDNPLEVAGVGALRRFDEYELNADASVPLYISLHSAKVIVVLEGELVLSRTGRPERTLVTDDVLLESGPKDGKVALSNPSSESLARFLLMAITASQSLEPMLRVVHADPRLRTGTAWPIVSGFDQPEAIPLPADLALYLFSVRRNEHLIFETVAARTTYLHLTAGSLRVGGEQLQAGDSARLRREGEVQLSATSRSEGILVDAREPKLEQPDF